MKQLCKIDTFLKIIKNKLQNWPVNQGKSGYVPEIVDLKISFEKTFFIHVYDFSINH